MTKRQTALTCAKIAGYHDDRKTFTRLVIECRVNLREMQGAFYAGQQAKINGVKCNCFECSKSQQLQNHETQN